MHCTLTPEQADGLRERGDVKQRLYVDEAGGRHLVSYIERCDRGQEGYTRRAVVCWNAEALGRGIVVLSPEVFFASTLPLGAEGEALPA